MNTNKRLLNELAKCADSPKEFIYSLIALQGKVPPEIFEASEMTVQHFYVAMNQISNGRSIGPKTCVTIARALDIDPYILHRVISDYKLKCYLDNESRDN